MKTLIYWINYRAWVRESDTIAPANQAKIPAEVHEEQAISQIIGPITDCLSYALIPALNEWVASAKNQQEGRDDVSKFILEHCVNLQARLTNISSTFSIDNGYDLGELNRIALSAGIICISGCINNWNNPQ